MERWVPCFGAWLPKVSMGNRTGCVRCGMTFWNNTTLYPLWYRGCPIRVDITELIRIMLSAGFPDGKKISRDACLGKQPSRIWCVSVCEMKALLAGFCYVVVWNVCMRYHSRAPGAPVSKDFWSSVCHQRLFLQSEELERCMASPRIFLYNYRNMKSWQLCHLCYWPNLKVCSFS